MGKAEKTRRYIIEKAAPIFNIKGLAGSSISDIMKATNLAKGGIYGNFTAKEELSVAVFDHITDILKAKLKGVSSKVNTSREKLLAILDFYEKYPTAPPMAGGCPILNFGVEADDTNPELAAKIRDLIVYLQKGIIRLIQRGMEAGEFKKDWDAEIFAIKMFTMIEGAILTSQLLKSSTQMSVIINLLKKEVETNSL